MSSKH